MTQWSSFARRTGRLGLQERNSGKSPGVKPLRGIVKCSESLVRTTKAATAFSMAVDLTQKKQTGEDLVVARHRWSLEPAIPKGAHLFFHNINYGGPEPKRVANSTSDGPLRDSKSQFHVTFCSSLGVLGLRPVTAPNGLGQRTGAPGGRNLKVS